MPSTVEGMIDVGPFLVTISKYIRLIPIRYIEDRRDEMILEDFEHTMVKYNHAGFVVKEIHCDPEFESIKLSLEIKNNLIVNLMAAQEHQGDIEGMLRTI
jgi:hypothetical protein